MQAEAGQSLHFIIARKNLERAAGEGTFIWGVGNSLKERVRDLVRSVQRPEVFFSPMLSKPNQKDVAPETLLWWRSFIDFDGRSYPMPEHSLVLSRGTTSKGPKNRHYALVCQSSNSLSLDPIAKVNIAHCRNWRSANPRVGSSQVSAVIEHSNGEPNGRIYDVTARAALIPPYFVTLSDPHVFSAREKHNLDQFVESGPSPEAWSRFVESLRERLNTFDMHSSK